MRQKKRVLGDGAGRYWEAEKGNRKRGRFNNMDDDLESGKVQTAYGVDTQVPSVTRVMTRALPKPIDTTDRTIKCRAPLKGCSARARRLWNVSSAKKATLVGLLYQRDFRTASGERRPSPNSVRADAPDMDDEYAFEAVLGVCTELEKDFLRLTSAPKPEAVRPPHVLEAALLHVKACWREKRQDYDWVCRQLKSIRQDYKVQHVANDHVVDVYQTHARIALENSDLGEFNTCVAQVRDLYEKVSCSQSVQDEFSSYRILYNLLVGASQWEQAKILSLLSVTDRNRPATRYAINIRHAFVSGNYYNYFKLAAHPPAKTMISYLLDHFHDRMRFRALSAMTAAYGGGSQAIIHLRFLIRLLGWSPEPDGSVSQTLRSVESVVPSSEEDVRRKLQDLNLYQQPVEVFDAVSYLAGVNIHLTVDRESGKPAVDRVLIDFKATKATGLQVRKPATKLITHAGSSTIDLR